MKKILLNLFSLCSSVALFAQSPYKNPQMDKLIDGLMSKMTIKEKIGQLNLLPSSGEIVTGQAQSSDIGGKIASGDVGGVFNIKGAEKIYDLQKLAVEKSRLGIPLLFGMDVIHGYETIFPIPLGLSCTWNMAGIEKSARIAAEESSADGINWTFSPMVDISRDPRWGRVSEGSGEDPYLGGEIAKAMVWGYQGKGEAMYKLNSNIMACVKHYALYGASEAGRDYNTVDMSRIRMFNEYMYPYQAAVDAGVGSVMASFNEIDGVPATANKWLLTDVLRHQWGFEGFVVTDYTGISEMIAHGIGNLQTVAARALLAGVDMDMVSEAFTSTLMKSLKEGKITENDINQACRRILEAKYILGLFDNPYKFCDIKDKKKTPSVIYSKANRDFARELAAESFVLLKNDNKTLPIKAKGKIAVVGPLGNTKSNMPGTWSVAAKLNVPLTVVEALKNAVGSDAEILYAKGSNLTDDAELEKNATMFGRSLHRDNRTNEEMLQEALKIATESDIIIATLGESSEFSGEASSRTDINIPDVQQALLKELVKTGKPVVLVLFTGRPLTLSWENENVPAILNVWFGGSEAADAISDVLLGKVNPSGKLTMSFPRNVGQIPLYYNHKTTGRPKSQDVNFEKFRSGYIDSPNSPLYPFGYGLSYTTFDYSNITLSKSEMDATGNITASIKLTNSGEYDGYEIVQMYIQDIEGSITRPVQELKGFQRVFVKAGETIDVSFSITEDTLKFYNSDLNLVAEPGEFNVMIGTSSAEYSQAKFTLK